MRADGWQKSANKNIAREQGRREARNDSRISQWEASGGFSAHLQSLASRKCLGASGPGLFSARAFSDARGWSQRDSCRGGRCRLAARVRLAVGRPDERGDARPVGTLRTGGGGRVRPGCRRPTGFPSRASPTRVSRCRSRCAGPRPLGGVSRGADLPRREGALGRGERDRGGEAPRTGAWRTEPRPRRPEPDTRRGERGARPVPTPLAPLPPPRSAPAAGTPSYTAPGF